MVALQTTKGRDVAGRGKIYGILAGKLFDSIQRTMRSNQVIMIDRELGVIVDVMDQDEFQRSENGDIEFFDFGEWTVLPGFVDVHVHWPRSSLFPSRNGVEGVLGAEVADGIGGCIREVRKQVGVGADWIKIYADYRVRAQMGVISSSVGSRSIPTFSRPELEAMIRTAHDLGVKVAAHANTATAIENLLDVGVDSIEHGAEMFDKDNPDTTLIKKLAAAKQTTKWVPTLAAYHALQTQMRLTWEQARETFIKAVIEEGLENVACGGDTGVFDHGENAKELILMRQLGATWEKVLSWATIGGWECIRGVEWEGDNGEHRLRKLELNPVTAAGIDRDVPFGVLKKGWAADLVGIEGDLTGSPGDFERAVTEGVKLVIKSGKFVKCQK
ncbi:hypothetical protein NP233_g9037 [Leucocoprinus birnbaumii]|uniref:Amidohydrolase-related domain-containing protein n=1 Tax=Leucocoprinus birnbaumii TaxID=56174 RepID=A0AAD5VMX6_9AGAR|nr:hypothetical protein NP233_g9037 [Leucocoprinus birnbaumii]